MSPAVIAQRDLRNDSSAILARVAAGESFTVTVRGEAIAELRPVVGRERFVSRDDFRRLVDDAPADRALLDELREMDVDPEDE
ncbi:MAG: type II toxin-antitoxin system prevent-host-death family antitoxin [Dermatophilaceae bacterium]